MADIYGGNLRTGNLKHIGHLTKALQLDQAVSVAAQDTRENTEKIRCICGPSLSGDAPNQSRMACFRRMCRPAWHCSCALKYRTFWGNRVVQVGCRWRTG